MFEPPVPAPAQKSWFGWAGGATDSTSPVNPSSGIESKVDAAGQKLGDSRAGDEVVNPLPVTGTGLVATLRNVFIPTPNPELAPAHPADPVISKSTPPGSATSSTSSLQNGEKKHMKTNASAQSHHLSGGKHKHEDYLNTLEISTSENQSSREAVVVMHGYAAALGYVVVSPVSKDILQSMSDFLIWVTIASSSVTGNPSL